MMKKGKTTKSVIRVVIVPKLSLGESDSDEIEESELTEENEELDDETETDDDSEKFEVPEIVITETDEVIEGMKHPLDSSKLMSNSDNLLLPEESGKNKLLTTWKEAARPKQPKLLPDSFVHFIADCKNLIADLRKTMDERLDAGEWILQFDGNIERLEQEEREERERVRREKEREEAARARAEAWWRRRPISRPLVNPAPRLSRIVREDHVEDGRSCHDRVCSLPLLALRKRLEKAERLLLAEGTLRPGLKREDVGKTTRMVLQKMAVGFKAYLAQIQVKAEGGVLEVHGEALVRPEDKRFDVIVRQKREVLEAHQDEGVIEEVLHVGRKRVYGKVVTKDLADQYCFQWKFTRAKGSLRLRKRRSKNKVKILEKTENIFAIFNPEKSKRAKGYQVFGSTLHTTRPKYQQHGKIREEEKDMKKLTKTRTVGKFEKGKIFSYESMQLKRFHKMVRLLLLIHIYFENLSLLPREFQNQFGPIHRF